MTTAQETPAKPDQRQFQPDMANPKQTGSNPVDPFQSNVNEPFNPNPNPSHDYLNEPRPKNADAWQSPNEAKPHVALGEGDKLKDSGKDISKVNAPITSINPSSGKTLAGEKSLDNIKIVDKPLRYLGEQANQKYPLDEIEMDQGFFIPVEQGGTTDALIADLHKHIYNFQQKTGECEKDEKGDDVWESVVIQTKKRKDGVIQLEADGKPIVGANNTNRPKLIHSANFTVRAIVAGEEYAEGEKADTDGALVIRVL